MWRMVLTVLLLSCCSEGEITCRNENGAAVDWYILYKVPKLNNQGLEGLEYFYMDKNKSQWLCPINDSKGVLANTLQPLLTHTEKTSDFGFILYSDQPPNRSVHRPYGHSKGVVMMDKYSGVWLLHSTPNFPFDTERGNFWPNTGTLYGQTFICVTFSYSQFKQIGKHLLQIRAFPFKYKIPDDFFPVLQSVVNKKRPRPGKQFRDKVLTSMDGQIFKSFAKYSKDVYDAKDLYPHIADRLRSDFYVSTWRGSCDEEEAEEGRVDPPEVGRVDSLQGGGGARFREVIYTIRSVMMTLNLDYRRNVSWTNCNDHSKWGVSRDQNWTCIADLNRTQSQNKRPGGALCIKSRKVWKMFKGFINQSNTHLQTENRVEKFSLISEDNSMTKDSTAHTSLE